MSGSAEDLLHRLLEGEATAEERARLDAALAADPALRRRHDELRQVFQLLGAARLSPTPPDLREDVMRAVSREAARAPRPRRAAVPRAVAGWTRLFLPVAAAAASVALFWALRSTVLQHGATTSGTIGGTSHAVTTRVGVGVDAVGVRAVATPQGFQLDLTAGASGGKIELVVLGGGARLSHSSDGEVSATGTVQRDFQPAERWSVHGWASSREVPVQIIIRYQDGREVTRRLELHARRGPGPGG